MDLSDLPKTLRTRIAVRTKVSEERLEICNECEFLEKSLMQCKKCGCFLKLKTMFLPQKCPIKKWGEYDGRYDHLDK